MSEYFGYVWIFIVILMFVFYIYNYAEKMICLIIGTGAVFAFIFFAIEVRLWLQVVAFFTVISLLSTFTFLKSKNKYKSEEELKIQGCYAIALTDLSSDSIGIIKIFGKKYMARICYSHDILKGQPVRVVSFSHSVAKIVAV